MGKLEFLFNAVRRLDTMFPGYFAEAKHNHYADFGWPTTLTFDLAYSMFRRNSLAAAAVNKTVSKTWETPPELWETDDSEESVTEELVRRHFDKIGMWRRVAEADRRALVGGWSALIFRFKDGKALREPLGRVRGGLMALAEVVPAWRGQLEVTRWDTDERSETYGDPLMYTFREVDVHMTAVAAGKAVPVGAGRVVDVHPSRVVIWSLDDTLLAASALEPGFNDLMTLEKVIGAGGAGFWKNAKSAPVLELDKDAKIAAMAQAMGVQPDELLEKMGEQVDDYQRGFDKLLMLQGMTAKQLSVTLPSPEHFVAGPLGTFAATFDIPLKILIGNQNGERASTEDAKSWASACMSRRSNLALPGIHRVLDLLKAAGAIEPIDWIVHWEDLTQASMTEKLATATSMADINAKLYQTGELAFLPEEIRAVLDLEPLSEEEASMADPADDTGDPPPNPANPQMDPAEEADE